MSEPPARVLVTGASRGIGRAVAVRLLEAGRTVVLLARDEARLEELAADHAGRAYVLACDLVEQPSVVERAVQLVGGLDGLVHAAGVAPHAPLEAVTEAQLALCHALHVRAPLRMSQELAAHLRSEARGGSIVFVASTLAERPAPGTLVYSASKAALVALAKGLAAELAPSVRVNAVSPGAVDTPMIRARGPELVEALRRRHALGRLGTADEVAEAIVQTLDAPWTTGSVLTIDGGLSVG